MKKPYGTGILYGKIVYICLIALSLLCAVGCGPRVSSPEEVAVFENAGPITDAVFFADTEGSSTMRTHGPYRVIRGDLLEFQMPAVARVITSDLVEWFKPAQGHNYVEPYLTRITQTGTVTLPIIGEIPVAGRTLSEVEYAVINAYHPRYAVDPPMIVCQVTKYQSENERVFTVTGLVNRPGAFPYPPDVQYNLMEALAYAGGMDMVADPRYLKVYRQDADGETAFATFAVNSKELADAYKIIIKPGDVIYVGHTLNTRINKFMSDVFHITVGADTRYSGN